MANDFGFDSPETKGWLFAIIGEELAAVLVVAEARSDYGRHRRNEDLRILISLVVQFLHFILKELAICLHLRDALLFGGRSGVCFYLRNQRHISYCRSRIDVSSFLSM